MRVIDGLNKFSKKTSIQGDIEEGLCQKAHLDKRLDFTSPCKFLLTHTSRYLTRVTLDTSNNRMWIWNFLRAFVNLLDDDNLFASLTTLKDDGDLRVL
jgi:hypothetical protein